MCTTCVLLLNDKSSVIIFLFVACMGVPMLTSKSDLTIYRCAPGYVGNPQERQKCRPYDGKMTKKRTKGAKDTHQAQQSILLSEVYISIFVVVVYSTLRCGAPQIFVVIFIFLYSFHSISQFKTNCPVCEVLLACPVQRMFLLVFNSSCWDLISSKWDIFYFPGVSNLAFICNSLD